MAGFKVKPCCQRRIGFLLIGLGLLLVLVGIVSFIVANTNRNDRQSSEDVEKVTQETIREDASEDPDTSEDSDVSEDVNALDNPDATSDETDSSLDGTTDSKTADLVIFTSDSLDYKSQTYLIEDGTLAVQDEIPGFHSVESITAKPSTNPKSNLDSDALFVVLSAVPDREFTVSVLVSSSEVPIIGTNPDLIDGLQWLISYEASSFTKTARQVGQGEVVEIVDSEYFNIRFAGNEGLPDVEFYGPEGTEYYALMIYDQAYFTLILP